MRKQFGIISSLFTSALVLGTLSACGPAAVATDESSSEQAETVAASAASEARMEKDAAILDADAPAAEAAASRTYGWRGIKRVNVVNDGSRFAQLTVAIRVAYDSGRATYARSYTALLCTYDGHAYPCSFTASYLNLYRYGPYSIDQVGAGTSNTGSDGAWSKYGHWHAVSANGCRFGAALRSASSSKLVVGIEGHHYSASNLWDSTYGSIDICE